MYKTNLFAVLFICVSGTALAQNFNSNRSKQDLTRTYESAEKLLIDKNYVAALEKLKLADPSLQKTDSLLYLKIKILDNVYPTSLPYTLDLDSSLRLFFSKVNQYSFPEANYSEVAEIQNRLEFFKINDKNFRDSVTRITVSDNTSQYSALAARIEAYLQSNPNSYYGNELKNEYLSLETKRKQMIKDSTNRVAIRKFGKGSFLSLSYEQSNKSSGNFTGLNNYKEVMNYFNGESSTLPKIKYSIGASIIDIMFNLYTASRYKVSLDWNLIDAEYTSFDLSTDTLLRSTPNSKSPAKEMYSIKGGTRIGPSFTALINSKIAASIYYSARPGVQFIFAKYYFNSGQPQQSYEISPAMNNFNLSHEVGIKLRFLRVLYINPYVHFGNYNWQNTIKNEDGTGSKNVKANYSFSLLGIRIGV